MSSRSVAQLLAILTIALSCLASTNQCAAQQAERSLFVIQAPKLDQSGYSQRPSVIDFTPVSFQQEETTPREDDGTDDAEDSTLDQDTNELYLDDEEEDLEDDFDSRPPTAPMTMWSLKPMASISPGIRPIDGKSPADQSWQLTQRDSMPIVSSDKLFAWAAPNFSYKPLFFEDVALERYGQTRGFIRQPFVSGIHFLKSATFLPYYSLYDPVNSCDGPLGYCRPGDCVDCVKAKHFFGNPFNGQHIHR